MLKSNRDMKNLNKGDIPIRGITNNGEVGVIKLNREKEYFYRKKIKELYFEFTYLKENKTIQNILEIYKKTFYPYHNLELRDKSKESFSSNNFFEIFCLTKDNEIFEIFIYLSRYSTKAKIINKIFYKYREFLAKKNFYIIFQEDTQINRLNIDSKFIDLKEKAKFFSLKNFIKELIYFPIKEKIEETLVKKQSYRKIFINPLVQIEIGQERESVISYMEEWLFTSKNPILIIEGSGGVGKTTLVKKFMSEIKERDIVFIDSSDLIDSHNLNNVASFLKEYFNNEIEIPLEEELLSLLLDNGDLLVIIDGIDEIILKSEMFNFKDFLNNIFKERNGDLAKTKIILTIRSNIFNDWDEILGYEKLKLLGFDRSKIISYLKERKLDTKKERILSFLEKNFPNEEFFSPFIVEMIVNEFENTEELKELDINSDFLCTDIGLDRLIYLILDREYLKSEVLSVDEQIKLIIMIIKRFGLESTEYQLNEININDKNLKFLRQHPLFDFENDKLYLKYDFLENYFVGIDFLYSLSQCESLIAFEYFKDYLHKMKKIIIDEDEIERRKRKYKLDKDVISILLSDFLHNEEVNIFFKELILNKNLTEKERNVLDLIATVFYLVLLLNKFHLKDIYDNTSLLKEIFCLEEKNTLEKLVLNRKINKKYKFDFSDCKIKNSYINYPYFVESSFNEKTIFESSILERFCNDKNRQKFSFSKSQFNSDCFLSSYINFNLSLQTNEHLNKERKVEKDILKIIKRFYKAGSFKSIKKEKLKGVNEDLLEFLLKEKVIIEILETTKEKRKDKKYTINKEYQLEFEKIIEKQIRKNKLINDLIEKYLKIKRNRK